MVSSSHVNDTQGMLNVLVGDSDMNHCDETIEACFNRMYDQEFGDKISTKLEPSVEDHEALKTMQQSLAFVEGHYQIALPWRQGCPSLPDNRFVADRRLRYLKRRLYNDECTRKMYVAKIEEYIQRGYAERVPDEEQDITGPNVWYLPHHGVFKTDERSKLRVVFDCASKLKNTSINLQLLSGPDLVNNLCGVLMRFREHKYAMVADIEAMFHQVLVSPSDRDSLRFLWWTGGEIDQQPTVYRMKVHPFGATSSPSCASLALQHALAALKLPEVSQIKDRVVRSFYVDDCLLSLSSTIILSETSKLLRETLCEKGFRLTKFFCNAEEGLRDIPLADVSVGAFPLDGQPAAARRTLGVLWEPKGDHLIFQVEPWIAKASRRTLLSYIASLYDPLGLVSPFVLPAKCILQDLCRRKASWDETLMDDELMRWERCIMNLKLVEDVLIPRCYELNNATDMEIHGFSDASEIGYGAAVYLRITSTEGTAFTILVMGKSRVAPLKPVSIPRLELAAAVLVCKLVTFVREELSTKAKSTTLWSDSMAVLRMIRNSSTRYETYFANRLSAIHDLSEPNNWRFIRGELNPADIASRGLQPGGSQLQIWLEGPSFLRQPVAEWPHQPTDYPVPDLSMWRLNEFTVNTITIADETITETQEVIASRLTERLAGSRSWIRLLRGMAWLLRFCRWISPSFKRRTSKDELPIGPLTAKELEYMKRLVCADVQQQCFPKEYHLLRNTTLEAAKGCSSGQLRNLHPFRDEGLLRVGGRLRWAPLPFEVKHPIILPPDHLVTQLLIAHVHEQNGHVGTLQVLNTIREEFWIIRGQATVRRVLRKCFHCRRWQAGREQQLMAPLPEERLRHEFPFTAVGIDYFGPLLIKRGRGTEKRYGCVFTCLSIRAVHLEVSHSLETDSFLCAFSRFVARRGCPSRIYSDNGTNFRGAESELKSCLLQWDQSKIQTTLASRGCEWNFTPPMASHRGGVWERMIRSIRKILKSMFGNELVNDEVLQTTLIEVENILNDRPLTKLSDDPEDVSALTPNHLLLLRDNSVAAEPSQTALTRRWRQAQHLSDAFWSRWIKEYLPILQYRSKWLSSGRDLMVGDLVLLVNVGTNRGLWPKGIVDEAKSGRDGRVREALVRTATGRFRRDIRSLCLLERSEDIMGEQTASENPGGNVNSNPDEL